MIPRSLPSVQDQLMQRIVLRFVTNSTFPAVGLIVTFQNLLDAWFIATTTTGGFQLFDYVRVKCVTIRAISGIPSGQAPQATVMVEFPGATAGFMGNGKMRSDSQIGFDEPAMVSLKPDKLSLAANFQISNAATAFVIRSVDAAGAGLGGTVVDVDLVYRNSSTINPAAIATARTGLTTGDLYFNGIDGQPVGTTVARSVFDRRS
jgi:hypothetical protein